MKLKDPANTAHIDLTWFGLLVKAVSLQEKAEPEQFDFALPGKITLELVWIGK